MPWYAYLLAPAAFLFQGITAARNFLFDRGLIPSQKSPIQTLVVGNVSVGGTGKTPWVEFLVRKLRGEVVVGTLSRGYGRKAQGFIQVLLRVRQLRWAMSLCNFTPNSRKKSQYLLGRIE